MIRTASVGLIATALAACQPSPAEGPAPELRDAWARATAPGQDAGGAFLSIEGGSEEDRLIGGSTPVARSVEIHAMQMDGEVMRMRRQDAVPVPAGAPVKLEPGGLHLMLMGLDAPLKQGAAFPLTLDFEKAGRKQVEVKVLAITSTGPRDGSDD